MFTKLFQLLKEKQKFFWCSIVCDAIKSSGPVLSSWVGFDFPSSLVLLEPGQYYCNVTRAGLDLPKQNSTKGPCYLSRETFAIATQSHLKPQCSHYNPWLKSE